MERGLSPKTVEAYQSDLTKYTNWLRDARKINDINEITQLDIEEYVRAMAAQNLGPRTVSRLSLIHI